MGGGMGGGMGGTAGGGMGGGQNVNVNRNVDVNRNVAVRPWVARPYYGTVVGGVALGTLIAVTAVPVAPAPDLCWNWT